MQILRKEMKLKGITVAVLAVELGVSRQMIYSWLSGNSLPGAINVVKLRDMGFSETASLTPSKIVEV